MDSSEVREQILLILDTFGMTGKKAAEIMGVKYPTFRQRMHEGHGNYFSEKNLIALKEYIKEKAEEL